MENKDKGFSFDDDATENVETPSEGTAPRARNRTVMLSPEITGQVRARLSQEPPPPPPPSRSADTFQPPESSVAQSGAFYTPSRGRSPVSQEAPPMEPRISRSVSQQPVAPPAAQHSESREGLVWQKKTPVVGFLVSYDKNPLGEIYELRSGRIIITSESAGQGNFLLIKDESVSPMHAILRISTGGEVQVLDQLSEFGTKITRFGTDEVVELSGDKGSVEHGDTVFFGKRKFHVCLIATPAQG